MSPICYDKLGVSSLEDRAACQPHRNHREATIPDLKEPRQVAGDPAQAESKSAEQPKTYDIYLTKQCDASPVFGDLLQEVPALADPALLARIRQWKAGGPGFLGLDLSRSTARAVLQRLRQARACGYRIASAYREPKIPLEQATPIAERAIAELQQRERYRGLTFDPTSLLRREPACWVFCAPCPAWYEADYVPGALHMSVDRLDGHVWQYDEFEELHDADLPRLPVFPLPTEQSPTKPVAQREPAVV